MDDIRIAANDKLYDQPFIVKNGDDAIQNLTGFTVYFLAWVPGVPESPVVDGVCVVDDAAAGTCHYVVQATDFTTPGEEYWGEIELQTPGGKRQSVDTFRIEVIESAAH